MDLDKTVHSLETAAERVISLGAVPADSRVATLKRSADALTQAARERFPESQGYVIRVEDGLAPWAWPRGAESEAAAMRAVGPAACEVGLRRTVRIRRGLTWGLSLPIAFSSSQLDDIRLGLIRESPLTVLLVSGGSIAGAAGGVGLFFAGGWDGKLAFVIAVFGGFLAGLALGGLLWLVSQPLVRAFGNPLSADEARRIHAEIGASVEAAVGPPT